MGPVGSGLRGLTFWVDSLSIQELLGVSGEKKCPGLVFRVRAQSSVRRLQFSCSSLIIPLGGTAEQVRTGVALVRRARAEEAGSGRCGMRGWASGLACPLAHLGP